MTVPAPVCVPLGILALFAAVGPCAAVVPPRSAAVALTWQDGVAVLSLTANEAPLKLVLDEVARQAGFEVTEVIATERAISAKFEQVPLQRALERLLEREDFVLLYGPADLSRESTGLSRVIVLGTREHWSMASPQTRLLPEADLSPETDPSPSVLPRDASMFDPDGPVEQLLQLASHDDERMRQSALEALTLHADDERARTALLDHLRDASPNVRCVVIGLLGRFLGQWPGVGDAIFTALGDSVPSVRHVAVFMLWEASSPRASDALTLAYDDVDSTVRDLAEELSQRTLGTTTDADSAPPPPAESDQSEK